MHGVVQPEPVRQWITVLYIPVTAGLYLKRTGETFQQIGPGMMGVGSTALQNRTCEGKIRPLQLQALLWRMPHGARAVYGVCGQKIGCYLSGTRFRQGIKWLSSSAYAG